MKENYKTCYLYDSETGEYKGDSIAQLSPEDWKEGRELYLMPPCATLDGLPDLLDGYAAVRMGSAWTLVPDYRGRTFYDTQTRDAHKITGLNETPLDTWTEIQPTDMEAVWKNGEWAIPFEVLRSRKIAAIRQEADEALLQIQSGYSKAEVISWSKQEAGARELTANPDARTPDAEFVRAMADARGIPTATLVDKIMGNLSPYADTMAQVLGRQQAREDQALAATTAEELECI